MTDERITEDNVNDWLDPFYQRDGCDWPKLVAEIQAGASAAIREAAAAKDAEICGHVEARTVYERTIARISQERIAAVERAEKAEAGWDNETKLRRQLGERCESLMGSLDFATAQVERMREVLTDISENHFCPICGRNPSDPCKSHCRLAAALSEQPPTKETRRMEQPDPYYAKQVAIRENDEAAQTAPESWDTLPEAERERLGRVAHAADRTDGVDWSELESYMRDNFIRIARAVWEASR